MKNLLNSLLVIALFVFSVQCTIIDEEDLVNPNAPSPDAVEPDFLLNSIMLNNADLFESMSDNAAEVVRMEHMFGATYNNAFQPQAFNFEWSEAYANILIDAKTLIPIANENQLFVHSGIARVIRAYTLVNLVDHFGDVPLSEALDGSNFNPNVDAGSDVYDFAFADLDSAKLDFAKNALADPGTEPYYGSDTDKWTALANTLQLKILYQKRNVEDNSAAINNLLSSDLIDEDDEAWVFPYSTNSANPDSRHPKFTGNYLTGAGEYMANYFMNELWNGKSIPDPRIRYYLYRQADAPTTDVNEQDCINNPPPSHYTGISGDGLGNNDPHCEDWNDVGYWGRDHGNDDGIPPDNLRRTTWGAFPAGGRFDADQAEGVDEEQGLQGAGIQPLWLPAYTEFVRAEVELMINGNPGAARAALSEGINKSIDFVEDFGADAVAAEGSDAADSLAAQADTVFQAQYETEVLGNYDGASNTDQQLSVIAKEFYLALFGNGIEAYNLYRRTSYPRDFQPNLSANPGTFIRSFEYPADFIETNSSVGPKAGDGVRVFWDNLPSPNDLFDF